MAEVEQASTPASPAWVLYVLVSETQKRTYVGVATNHTRRLRQHNGELAGGARATRAGRPWRLGALYGPFEDRSAAQCAEAKLKRQAGSARLTSNLPVLPLPGA